MSAPLPPDVLLRAARILVIKLDELGDFVLATPFLRGLRASAPHARISLAVTGPVLDLARDCPYADAVVVPETADGRLNFRAARPEQLQAFAGDFRQGFDLVINARFDTDTQGAATLAAATRAPVRLAHSERVTPWKAEGNRGFDAAYTHVLPPGPPRHEVEQTRALLDALGGRDPGLGVEVFISDADREAARRLLGSRPRRLLAVAPTSLRERKNYPLDRLVRVLDAVIRNAGFDGTVLLGGNGDVERSRALAASLPGAVLDLTGRTTIREAAAVVVEADALVSMDSALAHIAAAVGTPVAALWCHPHGGDAESPYAPERFRPWGQRVLVVQPEHATPPCTDKCLSSEAHCIAGIEPESAAASIVRFLKPLLPS